MKRRYRDPDAKTDTPYQVLRGEFWTERKRELSTMKASQLEAELTDHGITLPDVYDPGDPPRDMRWDRMLWLRMRLAFANQNVFAIEHGQVPSVALTPGLSYDRFPGYVPTWMVNIFRDPDNEAGEKARITRQNNAIEARIREDE